MIKSFFLKLLTIIFVVVFQFSFLPKFGLHNYINLLLPVLIFWILLENYFFIYLMMFLGGVSFDLFSGLPLGSTTIIYLLLSFCLIMIKENLVRSFTPATFIIIVSLTIITFLIAQNVVFLTLGIKYFFQISIFVEIAFESLLIFILSFFFRKKIYSQ